MTMHTLILAATRPVRRAELDRLIRALAITGPVEFEGTTVKIIRDARGELRAAQIFDLEDELPAARDVVVPPEA
jgi:hypothetical protein